MDDDFRNEVATRTHTFVFENLHRYNPGSASIQTWAKWSSRNVALRVKSERYNLRKVQGPDGRWQRLPMTIAMDEEALSLAARPVPGPEEVHDAEWRRHLLWKGYDALANEGKLSLALHDIGGKTLAQTARESGMPVIRVRRLLEKNHCRMKRWLKREGVSPIEREPHYGLVWQDPDATAYDDDWTATQTAALPDEPDADEETG
jgi:DNA-directed RNA polymerase specialized sigma24 family protein